jgi:sugar lactone lactonase YvrE
MNKVLFLLITLIVLPNILFGQLPLYQWNSHLSFSSVNYVDGSESVIFAATGDGIFSYNRTDNSIKTLSSVDGLSDSGISAIKCAENSELLIVGYSNGNIDLVDEGGIFNIPYIKKENSIPKKSINRIQCSGDFAWLCCGFGIVKLNLVKKEIAETWVIGTDGASIEVFDISKNNTHYVAATSKGLYRAEINNRNLQDYSQWEKINDVPGNSDKFISATHLNGNLYALNSLTEQIHVWNGSFWQQIFSDITGVKKMRAGFDKLLIVSEKSVDILSDNERTSINSSGAVANSLQPEDAFVSADGDLWIGDLNFSLSHRFSNGNFELIKPNGPENRLATDVTSYNEKTYVATGSKTGIDVIQQGIHIYSENTWSTVNSSPSNNINNIIKVIPNPSNPQQYHAASWEDGLSFFDGDIAAGQFDQTNSPLEASGEFCRVGGIAYDRDNNLWLTNAMTEHQLHFISSAGEWHSFSYPGINNSSTSSGEIIVSRRGTKWIIVDDSKLFAVNSGINIQDINDDKYKSVVLRSVFSNANTTITKRYSKIYSIAEDLNGELWIGTNEGVVVFHNPEQVFDDEDLYGTQPGIDMGDELYHPLLEKEQVSAVAVDGSNRKWFGTFDSGVFLFSENGEELVKQFNTENSPLPSNHIKSIGINNNSGEIFFATERGLISYKGDATGGKNSYNTVYVYPNPIRETYRGDITIEGLMSETIVKITDIAGNLVFETDSNGGRATWDGNDSYGRRVNTGVYLVFCSTRTGDDSCVTKLLFIR